MENKKLTLIALAVFSIVILLAQNNIEKVFALTSHTIEYDDTCNSEGIDFVSTVARYIVLCTNGEVATVNQATHTVTEFSLPAPKTNFIYWSWQCTSGLTCYVTEISVAIDNDDEYIIEFSPVGGGAVISNTTVTHSGLTEGFASNFADIDNAGGWFPVLCDDNDYILINPSLAQTGTCDGSNFGTSFITTVHTNPQDSTKIAVTTSAGTNSFRIWNAGGSQVCQLNFASSGNIARNTVLSEWLVKLGNVVWRVTDACAGTGTVTHGLSGTLRHIEVNNVREELFVTDNADVKILNSTISTYPQLLTLDAIDDSNAVSRGTVGTNDYAIIFDAGGVGESQIQLWELSEVEEEDEEEPSEFCSNPANEDLLRCRLEEQGGALGGNFQGNPFDVSNSTSNILIQVGLLDGSDTNPATNGTGYLLLAVGLIIANVLLWVGTGGQVFTSSNLFIPALISFVIIGFFTVAGLVEPTILIISIVVLIALASPKIISIIQRGSSTGGDSS